MVRKSDKGAPKGNIDNDVVAGFGEEWDLFDQSGLTDQERQEIFAAYFAIFPWSALPATAVGMDLGCGSGRWAMLVAPRVWKLHCIDPSPKALNVAKKNLANAGNCEFHLAGVDSIPLADSSLDFCYSLGVLHHVPDTASGLRACSEKLKPGAPFLLYLYYAFDNKPAWYRWLWKLTSLVRVVVSRTILPVRYLVCTLIACFVYWPLARLARILEILSLDVSSMPLSYYRARSFYVMRTDALDRFGTRLEKRFTKKEIRTMMEDANLEKISFSGAPPYWIAIGFRK